MNDLLKSPLVSVIVRTKDRPKLLINALRSIASQTYRPIEVVLVNDGGSELAAGELQEVLGDITLRMIRLEKNMGRAHAGNTGIEHATGAYIGFLDDDDEFYPDHLSTLVFVLTTHDWKVAYSDSLMAYKEFDKLGDLITVRKELVFSQDFDYDYLFFENYIPFMCLLFERSVLTDIGGFDTSFDLYEDWDLLIRAGEKYAFHHSRRTTADYSQWCSEQQISQSNKDYNFIEQSYMKILKKHFGKISPNRIRGYIKAKGEIIKNLELKPEKLKERNYYLECIENLERRLQDLERTLQEKERVLEEIYRSNGWQALLKYYRIRDGVFPPDSKRRLVAKIAALALQHPKELVKALDRKNISRFLRQYDTLDSAALEGKVRRKVLTELPDTHPAPLKFEEEQIFQNTVCIHPMDGKERVLVVDRFVPTYDKDSGSLRMFLLLKILSELGYRVTFLPDDLQRLEPYATELQELGMEILYGNIDIERYLMNRGSLFQFVLLSRPEQTCKYLPLMRAYAINSAIIYDTVDLHWVRFERAAAITGREDFRNSAASYKSLELFNASCSDITFTITNEEKETLLRENPSLHIEVMPNIHEVVRTEKTFADRSDIMFIGGFLHQPNEDAVFYFLEKIFPLVKARIADMRFFVVGSDPSDAIRRLNSKDIIVSGYVHDVTPYFEQCRVFVSPLRYGAGMKGKIGQSMAFGLPVVTTTIGAEGIGLIDGETALITDDPQQFAESIIQLYTNEKLWEHISLNSLDYIRRNYSKEVLSRRISDILNSCRLQATAHT